MRSLLLPLAACAALAGCATYGDPYSGYGQPGYYGYGQPSYGYGQPSYGYGAPGVSGSVYYSNTPGVTYGPGLYGGRQYRDRDGDGIPNRADVDRDGDGVPNAYDTRPNNPRRH